MEASVLSPASAAGVARNPKTTAVPNLTGAALPVAASPPRARYGLSPARAFWRRYAPARCAAKARWDSASPRLRAADARTAGHSGARTQAQARTRSPRRPASTQALSAATSPIPGRVPDRSSPGPFRERGNSPRTSRKEVRHVHLRIKRDRFAECGNRVFIPARAVVGEPEVILILGNSAKTTGDRIQEIERDR